MVERILDTLDLTGGQLLRVISVLQTLWFQETQIWTNPAVFEFAFFFPDLCNWKNAGQLHRGQQINNSEPLLRTKLMSLNLVISGSISFDSYMFLLSRSSDWPFLKLPKWSVTDIFFRFDSGVYSRGSHPFSLMNPWSIGYLWTPRLFNLVS